MVTMRELTKTLIPMGWNLPVFPELEQLTVAGLIVGAEIETSSHKYGLFHRICRSYDLVVSNGDVLHCSKEENSFAGIPFSYGTLGFFTAVEIEIIPAPRFVKLEYHPAHTVQDGLALLETHAENRRNDFVEGIMFSRDKWVVMTGQMVTSAESSKINEIGWWWKPWFFRHVETFLKGHGWEFIPLRDYYHRHSRCTFWVVSASLPYWNWSIFRYLFGWVLPFNFRLGRILIPSKLFQSRFFIQDYIVPLDAISELIHESEEQTEVYPIWLCPVKINESETLCKVGPENTNKMFYDVGIYGIIQKQNVDIPSATKALEKIVSKYKGGQDLYRDMYATKEKFGEVIDLAMYDLLRKEYDADDAFPDLYAKVSIKGRTEGL